MYQKAIYSHVLGAILGGDTRKIAEWLVNHGFQAIWAKVADGAYSFRWQGSDDLTIQDVEIFKSCGLSVYGWGFLYGKDPMGEANIAVSKIHSLKLDGYIFDCEGTYDGQRTAEANSYAIVNYVRQAAPDTTLGYCGWPRYWNPQKLYGDYGTWHPVKVAKAFMTKCDFFTPMVYPDGQDPKWYADLLRQSFLQWNRISDKPFIPAGRAYIGEGGKATRENILAFQNEADANGIKGMSWWFLDHAAKYPEIGDALKQCHAYTSSAPAPFIPACPNCGEELPGWTPPG